MFSQFREFVAQTFGIQGGGGLLLQLFLVVFLVVLVNMASSFMLWRLQKRLEGTRTPWDDAFIDSLRRPLYWLIWVVGLTFAVDILRRQLESPAVVFSYLDPARKVVVIGIVAWFLIRFIRRAEGVVVHKRAEAGEPVDHTTVDAVSKLLRLSVGITSVLVIMQTLGVNISGVLAFGGVGGIAVGFAARDMLANFFGGLTIYMDRPFSVGDWIRSPDRNIEGTVERVGWRQTRIRTFDQRPLYVPNATFSNIAVENPSRMLNRRIYETIGIRYQDAEAMGSIVEQVRDMLRNHDELDMDRTLIVNFVSFGPSSLDFFIYTFTKTTDWVAYHRIKQDVLLKVLNIILDAGADVAFPTSTLHLADPIRLENEAESPKSEQSESEA